MQATRIGLVINLKTAKALGITVPLPLIGRVDELRTNSRRPERAGAMLV